MSNLTIHNLEDSVTQNLRALAQQHGHSVEEEVRQILRSAFFEASRNTNKLGSKISQRFTELGGIELPQPNRSLPR